MLQEARLFVQCSWLQRGVSTHAWNSVRLISNRLHRQTFCEDLREVAAGNVVVSARAVRNHRLHSDSLGIHGGQAILDLRFHGT